MAASLPAQTKLTAGIPSGTRTGTVVSGTAAGWVVNIAGTNVGPMSALDSCLPRVGDVVVVFVQDSAMLILGRANPRASQWVTIPLVAGWTGTLRIRYLPGAAYSAQIAGAGLVPGTKADGTTVGTLPSGFFALSGYDLGLSANITVAGGQSPHLNIAAGTGVLTCWGCASATFVGVIPGVYPLDI